MPLIHWLILSLSAWRLASLLAREDGPWELLHRVRLAVGVEYDPYDDNPYGKNPLAKGLICVWCSSVWWGILFGLAYWLWPAVTVAVLLPLAISAGAILVERIAAG